MTQMPTYSQYEWEVTTVAAFVQQIAVSCVGQGYWFYVTGRIPTGKDRAYVDRKLVERYGAAASKWTRARRKAAGLANVRYLRHREYFILLATRGEHAFFRLEREVRDVRREPIKFGGYSIGCRLGTDRQYHPSVRIELAEYRKLKAFFLVLARRRSAAEVAAELSALPYEPYAPVRRQLMELLRAINRERKQLGAEPVPARALRLWRRPVRVFGPGAAGP